MIYLDNAATTQVSDAVFAEMAPWVKDEYGNPGSLYGIGRKSAAAVDLARERTASLFGCSPEQVIFTSGGSEGNNLVIKGLLPHLDKKGRKCFVTSAIEHDSVLHAVNDAVLIKPEFDKVILPPCKRGYVRAEDLSNCLDEVTAGLVSIMFVNNETGAINDIAWMGHMCHKGEVLFHSDCVQAAGCFELDRMRPFCDFMTVSSHKIHGPKGVGAVYAADPSILTPLISGGSHQEHGLRGGTENVPGIVGFGKACELAARDIAHRSVRIVGLKKAFYHAVISNLFEYGRANSVAVNGTPPNARGKVLSLRFDGVDAQTMILALEHAGVCCSAGSACTSHDNEPSHVLTAMGIEAPDARSTIRFSFSDELEMQDVVTAARAIADTYKILLRG